METSRLETFSDGVFAIAATLLILDIRLPEGHGSVAHQLVHLWPSYAGYAVSFLTIGIMWINHAAVFRQIGRVDRTFLTINVVFLLFIAFVPFPTAVLARHLHHDAKAAAFFYGLTLTCTAVMYQVLWFYASLGRRLLVEDADPRVVSGITRAFLPGVPFYASAMVSALVSSWLSVALYAGISVFYVVESSIFGRDAA
ncbi:MAG TPA: TMEM175 family protein [Gaiellaceae bacterium]